MNALCQALHATGPALQRIFSCRVRRLPAGLPFTQAEGEPSGERFTSSQ